MCNHFLELENSSDSTCPDVDPAQNMCSLVLQASSGLCYEMRCSVFEDVPVSTSTGCEIFVKF